ncbi:MAG: ubiquinol-cytochrome c reductase iron-sulfur subunit [Planctomycetota bacterium]|nr:ubiquinol-cytochrome c reductase iron-sulfur subunit [Planctomycetota bacterium]
MATSEASQRAITAQNPSRDQQRGPTRRAAVAQLLAGWSLFSLAAGVGLLGCVRFLFPNVLYEPPATFNAGMPSNYGVGVDETFKNTNSTWLVRTESDPLSGRDGIPGIFALNTVCTHLGCIPNWQAADNRFKCPCHGSGFRPSGMNFEGPAPRPLERWRVVLSEGELMVDMNQKYQWEKGQWVSPESYVVV